MNYDIIKADIDTIFQKQKSDGSSNENLELFIQYFNVLPEEEKSFVFKYYEYFGDVVDGVDRYNNYLIKEGEGCLYFLVGIFLGRVEYAIDNIYANPNCGGKIYSLLESHICETILSALDEGTKNIYAQKLSEIIGRLYIPNLSSQSFNDIKIDLQKFILMWKVGNIRIKVNQVDVEIHSDQNEVVKLIQEFGFKLELNEYLTNLSSKNISEEDGIAFAGTIATYREFFGNMMIEISDRIAEITGEAIGDYYDEQKKKTTTPIGIARKHIKEKLQLSDKDNNLINKYMDIVHDEGGHNMFSSQTYFRLTKNIGIEILYMLLSKLKELEK